MPDTFTNTLTPLQPGDKLGRYRVVEQLGAGGASVTWLGEDALLDRRVALEQLLVLTTGEAGGGVSSAVPGGHAAADPTVRGAPAAGAADRGGGR